MSEILLDVQELTHCFRLGRNTVIRAVDHVSFQLRRGEIFGLRDARPDSLGPFPHT